MNQKSTESYKKLFIDNEITLRQLQVLQALKNELGMGYKPCNGSRQRTTIKRIGKICW